MTTISSIFPDFQYRAAYISVVDGETYSHYFRNWRYAYGLVCVREQWQIQRLSDGVVLAESKAWSDARKAVQMMKSILE
jgi:hypothetical protein